MIDIIKKDERSSKTPLLTVLLSFFNNKDTLKDSIQSVLNQSFRDFELILLDDGSTDGSKKIAKEFMSKKENILYLESKINHGLTKMLNLGVQNSRGRYIARQDADDMSLKSRFSKQIDFLKKNSEIDILGTNAKYFDGNKNFIVFMPNKDSEIKSGLKKKNTLIHPSVMIKSEILKKYKYDESFRRCQDYELWLRIKNHVSFHNIQEDLIIYNYKDKKYTFKELMLTSKARFKHISFFISLYYLIEDFIRFIFKKSFS